MDTQQVVRDDTGTMRCRECGFPYALSPLEVADRADRALVTVREAVAAVPMKMRGRRPAPAVWSVNAYVAHLAEAAAVIAGRLQAIIVHDRPPLASYDQDQTARAGRFDERPADDSLIALRRTVSACTAEIRGLAPRSWERIGLHAEAGEVRLSDIAHDLAHELEHHATDIRRVGGDVDLQRTEGNGPRERSAS